MTARKQTRTSHTAGVSEHQMTAADIMAKKLTKKTRQILEVLREKIESVAYFDNGEKWGCVYLDNARPEGMSRNAFAGHLAALKMAKLYKPMDGDAFGDVRLADNDPR